ncbi:MAG: thioredoxin domain-containing protein [Deltaproteobacteria bacterium]|nr:thioredoxin domain-containing protein [Deltaproteobacteria bacterium]
MANRLAGESSPYLVQHADNPVEWWPWGEAAFAEARRRDVPVFVSIGYAACHWCHVMAHESFEDPAVAKLMNEGFVNVKVDREERPDVDLIYMTAIQVMGEGGGWPLSAFCTPDGKPYFLGTYFPPTGKYGRPGFSQLLASMSEAWREKRDQVFENVHALMDGLAHVDEHYRRGASKADPGTLNASLIVTAARNLIAKADTKHGGLGGAPKFPSSSTHDLLGRAGRLSFGGPVREVFLRWATAMAAGGIYDHVGGGFARYAVDAAWLVPHFEKMLYDNAQLLGIYADAVAMTGDPGRGAVIPEIVTWLGRELSDPAGGLWSSLDADSEGEEGKFYVWTPATLRAALGPADAIQFAHHYGVTEKGNFEHGQTVLSRVTPIGAASDEAALADMRARLYAARAARIRPGTDDKVLAGWNGLAITGLVRAWEATGLEDALVLARRVGDFLVREMIKDDRITRIWKGGAAKLDGTLDDYAFVASGFLDLAEATGDATWWQRGVALVDQIRARFIEVVGPALVFFLTANDDREPLIHRPESSHDGAIPAGASVTVECLLRVGAIGGDASATALAERYLAERLTGPSAASAFALSRLLGGLDLYLHGQTLVITEGEGREALLTAARRAYAPTLAIAGSWASDELRAGKTPGPGGRARAYLCRGQTCSAPVETPVELQALLAQPL